MNRFTIRGTRGTVPACGPDYHRYGGHTTCFTVQTDAGWLIIDAGTGIGEAAREISAADKLAPITLMFTHLHQDHLLGLPSFDPLHRNDAHITIMADPSRHGSWRDHLETFMSQPFWPVALAESDARTFMKDLPIEEPGMDLYGIRVSFFHVPHPQQCVSFRLAMPGQTVVVATDVEYTVDTLDREYIDFCRGADNLIFDTQYTPDEYAAHKGWGHSTWEVGVALAKQAEVNQLVLAHHAPRRSDTELDAILERARSAFPNTIVGHAGLRLEPGAD